MQLTEHRPGHARPGDREPLACGRVASGCQRRASEHDDFRTGRPGLAAVPVAKPSLDAETGLGQQRAQMVGVDEAQRAGLTNSSPVRGERTAEENVTRSAACVLDWSTQAGTARRPAPAQSGGYGPSPTTARPGRRGCGSRPRATRRRPGVGRRRAAPPAGASSSSSTRHSIACAPAGERDKTAQPALDRPRSFRNDCRARTCARETHVLLGQRLTCHLLPSSSPGACRKRRRCGGGRPGRRARGSGSPRSCSTGPSVGSCPAAGGR
jgi:hypothetical protein